MALSAALAALSLLAAPPLARATEPEAKRETSAPRKLGALKPGDAAHAASITAPEAGETASIWGDDDASSDPWGEDGAWDQNDAWRGGASASRGWRDPSVWRDRGAAMPLSLRPAPPKPTPVVTPPKPDVEAYPAFPPGVPPIATLRPRTLKPGVAPFESAARALLAIDADTGEVLHQHGAYEPIHPASMTKVMTLLVALNAVQAGEIALDDPITVSANAAGRPGSTMALRAGQKATLSELLTGLMVVSGNDAAIAVAEAVAGGVGPFVARMNETAKALGLEESSFRNPTGFTAKGHRMSARDIARLAQIVIEEHPEAAPMFSRRRFTWSGAVMPSTNPLMYADLSDINVTPEGLKTGFTGAAGYCVVISAVRREASGEARRVIAVLAGLPSKAARRAEASQVVRWAFGML
ncbi:MAG: D-alanyl-D-alanine carboxypeptidase family protein [Pseudomonadota bacterium]